MKLYYVFVYACVRAFVPACGRCNVGPIHVFFVEREREEEAFIER